MKCSWLRAGAMIVSAMLAACTPATHVKDHLVLAVAGCATAPFNNVDWSAARSVDIRIRQDEFQPMVVGLARDVPYVLHIRNADRSTHSFRAPTFFRQAAVAQITVDGKPKPSDGSCINGVTVPPDSAVEIRLIALLEGRYAFANPSWFDFGVYPDGNGVGTILVD